MLDPKLVVRLEASFRRAESLRVWMFTNHFYRNGAYEHSLLKRQKSKISARLRGWCGCLRGTPTLPEPANGFDQEP